MGGSQGVYLESKKEREGEGEGGRKEKDDVGQA